MAVGTAVGYMTTVLFDEGADVFWGAGVFVALIFGLLVGFIVGFTVVFVVRFVTYGVGETEVTIATVGSGASVGVTFDVWLFCPPVNRDTMNAQAMARYFTV